MTFAAHLIFLQGYYKYLVRFLSLGRIQVESLFMVTVADYVSAEKCFVPVAGGNANLVPTPNVRSQ